MSITTTTSEIIELVQDPRFIRWYVAVPGASDIVRNANGTAESRQAARELAQRFPDTMRDRFAQFIEHEHGRAIVDDIARVWDEAHAIHAGVLVTAQLDAERNDDSKVETAARELSASPAQLARLRVLVQTERDAVRLQRERDELARKVDELSVDIERYDPRMRPMLENLAQLAVERSFCSEFDLVLDHIGGPSRDDLLPEPSTSGHHHVSVTLRISIDVDDIHEEGIDKIDILRYISNEGIEEDDISDYTVDDSCLDEN